MGFNSRQRLSSSQRRTMDEKLLLLSVANVAFREWNIHRTCGGSLPNNAVQGTTLRVAPDGCLWADEL